MCDACTAQWSKEAFAGNHPLYEGEPVSGYCLLCNVMHKRVRMRTWFLCDICYRVAGSIGRNHVAEQAILQFWEDHVRPRFPNLTLVQNDPSSLLPRRETDQSAIAPVDFLARDATSGKNVFAIENKTGRSSISEMSQFQLDVSDCDTILNEMRALRIPVYIVHAQVLETWHPPTMGFRVVGLWWSDVYRMAEHFKSVSMRRDEMRGAAYFNRRAFLAIETLPDALQGKKNWALVEKYRREGIPKMYRDE
jgi:hypothetical protein